MIAHTLEFRVSHTLAGIRVKTRKTVLQSQSDVCQTTDKDVPLTPIFFVCALASNKFVCLASKTGVFLSETDSKRFLDSVEYVCCSVLQRQPKIFEVGGTPEGTREDGFTGVHRNIH